jgi:hypothetical protein
MSDKRKALIIVAICLTGAVLVRFIFGDTHLALRLLPFNKPLIGNIQKFEDLGNRANIYVFGVALEESSDTEYLKTADALISTYELSNKVNLLFFDVEQEAKIVVDVAAGFNLTNFSVFAGGKIQMWAILRSFGIEEVVSPVIVYADKNNNIINVKTGGSNKDEIVNDISELLGNTFVTKSLNENNLIDILADSFGDTEQRKAQIIAYRDKLSNKYGHLETLNFARFLIGLPADVTTTEELNSNAKLGAQLMAESEYGHTPPKPESWEQDIYNIALTTTAKSNIAYYFASDSNTLPDLSSTILHGWMADNDIDNLEKLGHRRWFLNPDLLYVGFGQGDKVSDNMQWRFLDAYAADTSRGELVQYEAIAYPSGAAFPNDVFHGDYPWSITLNPNIYEAPNHEIVSVTLRGNDNIYEFNQEDSALYGNFFRIDTSAYGIANCIIFRPIGIAEYLGEYTVTVNGLKAIGGEAALLTYSVNFFYNEETEFAAKVKATPPTDSSPEINTPKQGNADRQSHFDVTLSLDPDSHLGDSFTFKVNRETSGDYRTSDATVAKVSESGIVRAVGKGVCRITVIYDDAEYICLIRVKR